MLLLLCLISDKFLFSFLPRYSSVQGLDALFYGCMQSMLTFSGYIKLSMCPSLTTRV